MQLKVKQILIVFLLLNSSLLFAQQAFYNVNSGNGNGVRFWETRTEKYKIHMGRGTEYQYGPVTDYSIKTNMSEEVGRGWTWGGTGRVPIAALSNIGVLQIKRNFITEGSIGIGVSNPRAKLDVSGNMLLENGSNPVIFTSRSTEDLKRYVFLLNSPRTTMGSGLKASGILVSDTYAYANPGKNDLIVKGSVGIGTNESTDARLSVKGLIKAEEVKVTVTEWPDYVFADSYQKMSLNELRNYIEDHSHLPDVPSEAVVLENGIALGEMQSILLKKIEELTLYILDQESELQNQAQERDYYKSEFESLNERVVELEKLIKR